MLHTFIDANYREEVARIVDGEMEKGHCGIQGCDRLLDLRLKCHTCGKYVHDLCAIANDLFQEGNGTHCLEPRRYCSLACKPST